jgi:hypothetical protein
MTTEEMEAVVAGIEEGRRIERRYALLQAAATIYAGMIPMAKEMAECIAERDIEIAVNGAEELYEEIMKREGEVQ